MLYITPSENKNDFCLSLQLYTRSIRIGKLFSIIYVQLVSHFTTFIPLEKILFFFSIEDCPLEFSPWKLDTGWSNPQVFSLLLYPWGVKNSELKGFIHIWTNHRPPYISGISVYHRSKVHFLLSSFSSLSLWMEDQVNWNITLNWLS